MQDTTMIMFSARLFAWVLVFTVALGLGALLAAFVGQMPIEWWSALLLLAFIAVRVGGAR